MAREPAVAEYYPQDPTSPSGLLAGATTTLGGLGAPGHADKLRTPVIPWEACRPVPIRASPITTAAGTVDLPDQLGPHDPYWWDIKRLGAWGFTAGTLTVFLNNTAGEQLAAYSTPGNVTWSTQLLLAPRDRLILVAAGITGTVQITGQAIEVATPWLPEYLL